MKKNRITIKQIALEAGVSIATVSRVFNGKDPEKVGPKARQRVLETIQKHNYTPNVSAKGLVCGKSSLIGLQVLCVEKTFNSDTLAGVEEKLSEKGYSIILGVSAWDKDKEEKSIQTMLRKGVEGIIWMPIGRFPDDSIISKIKAYSCPFLWLGKDLGRGIPYVMGDNEKGGFDVALHCFENGFEKLAFIGIDNDPHSELREKGYMRFVKKKKLSYKFIYRSKRVSEEEICEAVIKNLESEDPANAFICSSDELCIGAYQALRSKKLKIGRDVAVTGYTERDYAKHLTPPLTSVSMQNRKMGEEAASSMLKQINGEVPEHILVPPKLIIRDSSKLKKQGRKNG